MKTKVMIVALEYTEDYNTTANMIRGKLMGASLHMLDLASLEDYTLEEALEFIQEIVEETD